MTRAGHRAPESDISAEERGDTSVHRTALTRSLMVITTAVLAVGIVAVGNIVAGTALPWASVATADVVTSASPDGSAAPGATPGPSATPLSAAGGLTGAEDRAARLETSEASAVVTAVDTWLTEVSRLSWKDRRAVTDYGTVILSAREKSYGLRDLIARGALKKVDDTTYDLVRAVVVRTDARLAISAPGVTIRLVSTEAGFTEIVGWGGDVVLNGTAEKPLTITSWDAEAEGPDTDVDNGRGFILVRNGVLSAEHTEFRHLGFWSGRTGGVAVTSTDVGLARAKLVDTAHDELAFGVYFSGVVHSEVRGATITDSLLTGIDITGASARVVVDDVHVERAGGDGISIARGSRAVTVSNSLIEYADEVGVRVSAAARADGANAAGYPTTQASGFTIAAVTANDNRRGGLLVDGGNDIEVDRLEVDGIATAVRVDGPVRSLAIRESTLHAERGAALTLDGDISDAVLASSTLRSLANGVIVRSGRVEVRDNDITVVEGAALSIREDARARVSGNTLSGVGEQPIASDPRVDVQLASNDLDGWNHRPGWLLWLDHHPMGWLWLLVLIIPAVGLPFAIVRARRRNVLRRMLEDAIVQYGRRQLETYRAAQGAEPAAPGGAPVDPAPAAPGVPAGVPAGPAEVPAEPAGVPAQTSPAAPSWSAPGWGSQVPGIAASVPAEGAPITINGVPVEEWPEAPLTRPVDPRRMPRSAAPHAGSPRSLRDLHAVLPSQAFTSPQQFAVAAVLEAGYPVYQVARLFRVPAWRLEAWIEDAIDRVPQTPAPAGRR
ncbi:right-handed parallel beta-helix repeat-containing protein [Microbacterium dauci]|uniref:Right-handed parallel beta-helix repeat-containing protein n=1 Tax=Microbacterium dauci TaxID=3048008 RepID=A0ABT6ZEC9_9MICO|nr:right-handed parallel beta-helix repeat-containing protein [Microbacterium sp. LX3-4]MDJ1114517.1 right-handed parallel beta-helix repeat-containing protein [Microbacterium sp. LX3-4]